ncbi:alpha-crystallin A chain-like [Helicoverpa zea]|uniref:alpha-crystallin A chain-like n=1 Tax=Helicoverpa zea TaxID=7113 RepID=UPI001F57A679|nr:alpha-crystallin A chain-like [Helicoverpa zea]
MFLKPIFGLSRPKLYSSINKHSRSLRPSIKIGKDRFQLSIDVHHFRKDELSVKAHPDYVVIQGKHEKDTEQGYILRQFIRKFKLPDGCIPSKIKCKISPDGMMTITAPRSFKDSSTPVESITVPICFGPSEVKEEKEEFPKPPPKKTYNNPCDDFEHVKPRER